MKKSLYFSAAALLSLGAAATACSDEDFGYTKEEIAYAKNFREAFGNVDPNQDWNLLAQLANGGAETRAAGNMTTPTGKFTITVLPENQAALISADKMKDYSKMLPESNVGNNPYATTNLGRVTQNFSVTTNKVVLYPVYYWTDNTDEIGLYYYSNETGSVSVNINGGGTAKIVRIPITTSKPEELEYSYETDAQWNQIYDYNYENYLPANYKEQLVAANIGFKITDGTEYSQYGEQEIAAGRFMKVGKNTLSYNTPAANAGVEFDCVYEVQPIDVMTAMATLYPEKYKVNGSNNYEYCASDGGTQYASVASNSDCAIYVDPAIDAALSDDPNDVINGNIKPSGFRSKGIVVDLPATMKIGFYVKHPNGTYQYSEGKLNGYMHWAGHTTEDECFVATYESEETDANGNPIRYLAFEDWVGGAGDYDLNDIVFRVYGFERIVDNEEITEEGLFVCEDLGKFDFDFNDVVLKASWKRYYKKTYNKTDGVVTSVTIAQEPSDDLTITAMAAGGNNPSDVYFKTKATPAGVKLGEIHELLNGSAPAIINAGEEYGGDGQSFNYEEAEFPVTWDKENYPHGYVSQIFGEGYLYVKASTTNSNPDQPSGAYNVNATHIISSDSYKTRGVPQMMLLPMYYEWCQEDQPIETVYPNFTTWVNDATKTDWITNGKVEAKTTDRGVTPEMFDRPAAPSSNLTQSTLSATPTSVSLYPSSTSATVSFTYEGSGNITYSVDDEDCVDVSITKNAGSGTITISRKSGWTADGTTYVRIEQAANTSYTSSEVVITVNNSAVDLTPSSFSVAETTKSILITTKGGEDITITDGTGTGSYSATSSHPTVATASITGSAGNYKVKITPFSAGNATITVTQDGNATYAESVQTIAVTVTLVASNFAVSENEVNLNANGDPATITIWSSNATKPTVSALSGTDNATIGEVTGGTKHWGAEHNDQYEWTVSVTPKSTVADGSTFTINQEATATMEGGSQTITVNVAAGISYGDLITFADNAKSGTIPASKFTSATTSATITFKGTNYYQYSYANENYIFSGYNSFELKFSGTVYSESNGGIKTIVLTGENLSVAKEQGVRITHGGYSDAEIYVKTE